MARESGLSHTTIRRIWAAFSVQPHRSETFKLSSDPHFVDKVRDIIGLYLSPPDRALVLCVDEKSQIQTLDRTQPVLPMLPGMPAALSNRLLLRNRHQLSVHLEIGGHFGSAHSRPPSLPKLTPSEQAVYSGGLPSYSRSSFSQTCGSKHLFDPLKSKVSNILVC